MKHWITATILVFILSPIATGLSTYETGARNALLERNYGLALSLAHKARYAYSSQGDLNAMLKAEDLVDSIYVKSKWEAMMGNLSMFGDDECEEVAGWYQVRMRDSFDHEDFKQTLRYGRQARELYSELYRRLEKLDKPTLSQNKQKNFYLYSRESVTLELVDAAKRLGCCMIGDVDYAEAVRFYGSGDYENALKNAIVAEEVFFDLKKRGELENARVIIQQMNDYILVEERAGRYYNDASRLLSEGHYDDALSYANTSFQLSLSVNSSRSVDSMKLMWKVLAFIGNKTFADDKLDDARTLYDSGDFIRGRLAAENAKGIYGRIGYRQGVIDAELLMNSTIPEPVKEDDDDNSTRLVIVITLALSIGALLITKLRR